MLALCQANALCGGPALCAAVSFASVGAAWRSPGALSAQRCPSQRDHRKCLAGSAPGQPCGEAHLASLARSPRSPLSGPWAAWEDGRAAAPSLLSPVPTDKAADEAGDVTCFSGSTKGSSSEVQSLSSFQSDSGDDNGECQGRL